MPAWICVVKLQYVSGAEKRIKYKVLLVYVTECHAGARRNVKAVVNHDIHSSGSKEE